MKSCLFYKRYIFKVKSSGITMFLCNILLFPKQSPFFCKLHMRWAAAFIFRARPDKEILLLVMSSSPSPSLACRLWALEAQKKPGSSSFVWSCFVSRISFNILCWTWKRNLPTIDVPEPGWYLITWASEAQNFLARLILTVLRSARLVSGHIINWLI